MSFQPLVSVISRDEMLSGRDRGQIKSNSSSAVSEENSNGACGFGYGVSNTIFMDGWASCVPRLGGKALMMNHAFIHQAAKL